MKKNDIIQTLAESKYEMRTINTNVLIIPRETYQRSLQSDEVKEGMCQRYQRK